MRRCANDRIAPHVPVGIEAQPTSNAGMGTGIAIRAAFVVALLTGLPVAASERSTELFVARTWHVDHGLPQNTVQAFCHAHDGFLWLGTRFGLARFDGHTFQTFQPTEIPAFRDGSIIALAEDARGTLWIATQDGLIRHDLGQFERVSGLEGERLWAIWPEGKVRLWLGFQRGLAFLEENRLRWIPPPVDPLGATNIPPDGLGVRSLGPDEAGGLIVTTQDNWFRLNLSSMELHPWVPKLIGSPTSTSIHQLRESAPVEWYSRPIALTSEKDFRRRIFTISNPGSRQWGPRTCSDGRGGWWFVAADRSLYRVDATGAAFEIVGPPTLDETTLAVLSDREGNHWIGTAVAGAVRLRSRLFDPIPLGNGRDAPCFTVALDHEGNPWTASRSLLMKVEEGSPQTWNIATPGTARQIHSLAPATDGGWWIGWERRGLYQWHPNSGASPPQLVDFEGDRPRALTVTRDGALWIGLETGVARLHQGVTARLGTADGLPHPDVRAIHEDRSGQIWVATFGGGIARRSGNHFIPYTSRDGLSSDTVWGFFEDKLGALWVYGLRGLTRVSSKPWVIVTREQGLFDDLTNQMIEDDTGHVWLGCNRGIYRVGTDELHAVADGRLDTLHPVVFSAADGLPVAETNGENQPAVARGKDGILWFPTPVGLLRVDSRRAPANESPPEVHFTHLRTESMVIQDERGTRPGLDRGSEGEVILPPGMARVIEAEFTAPHFVAPERIRFRHRLLGYDASWTAADSRRTTRYTNLRPGRYRLEVIACNSHGVWANQPAVFAFRVSPRIYENTAFITPAIALLALGLFAAHRLRLRIVTQRQSLETELRLARERERIARDMHDDVGASLTQIAFLTARAQSLPSASDPSFPSLIGRIAGTTRDAAQSMDEIVWALNPRNDRLDQLAGYICQFAREFLESTGILCRLEIPSWMPSLPVSSENRHHILMILKEALNNAVRHSGASEVRLGLEQEADHLILTLVDNGRGFEVPPSIAAMLAPQAPDAEHSTSSHHPNSATPSAGSSSSSMPTPASNNGLHHLARRVDLLGGTLQITSQPGQGTTLRARWPVRPVPRSGD